MALATDWHGSIRMDRMSFGNLWFTNYSLDHKGFFGANVRCEMGVYFPASRGDDRADSDIDIMVEIAPDSGMDVFRYVGIVHAIEDLFSERVDVSNRIALKPHVRPAAERDAIYAF